MTATLNSKTLTPIVQDLPNNHSSPAFSITMEQQPSTETTRLKLEALRLLTMDLHHREVLLAQEKKNSGEVLSLLFLKHPEYKNESIEGIATSSACNTIVQGWRTEKIAHDEMAKNFAQERSALLNELWAIVRPREDIQIK